MPSLTTAELVQYARLALSGKPNDVVVYTRRLARRARKEDPGLASALESLLEHLPGAVVRNAASAASPVPVDGDSRMELARLEERPSPGVRPIWAAPVVAPLRQFVSERQREGELADAGLAPTRTMLFTGPPGVGKTLAARWIASELGWPLITLDLSTVMSSFLGRTGNNLRSVLDFAKSSPCVMFLDEFDAIAKKRDDATEIGELKRLVTVLLQEIEEWPITGVLLAATNHADLLDPAVWRRFEVILEFPLPSSELVGVAIEQFLVEHAPEAAKWRPALTQMMAGNSFSDIERTLRNLRRTAVISGVPLNALIEERVRAHLAVLDRGSRREFAAALLQAGLSQRDVQRQTGVARDTQRKATPSSKKRPINGQEANNA